MATLVQRGFASADGGTGTVAIDTVAADGVYTWATRPAVSSVPVGTEIYVTDIGPSRVLLYNDGTYWRAYAPVTVVFDTTGATIAAATHLGNDTIVRSNSVAAGLLRIGRTIRVQMSYGKSGLTDAATAVRIRLGSAGTTADASFGSSTALGAASRSAVSEVVFYLSSATEATILGPAGGFTGYATGSGSSTASPPTALTIANADTTVLKFSCSIDLNGANDDASCHNMIVTVFP